MSGTSPADSRARTYAALRRTRSTPSTRRTVAVTATTGGLEGRGERAMVTGWNRDRKPEAFLEADFDGQTRLR